RKGCVQGPDSSTFVCKIVLNSLLPPLSLLLSIPPLFLSPSLSLPLSLSPLFLSLSPVHGALTASYGSGRREREDKQWGVCPQGVYCHTAQAPLSHTHTHTHTYIHTHITPTLS